MWGVPAFISISPYTMEIAMRHLINTAILRRTQLPETSWNDRMEDCLRLKGFPAEQRRSRPHILPMSYRRLLQPRNEHD
jgi:hypothetical protein